jgi:hypothetical protein
MRGAGKLFPALQADLLLRSVPPRSVTLDAVLEHPKASEALLAFLKIEVTD